jgi:hypothetical protein
MFSHRTKCIGIGICALVGISASSAFADFAGQTILGPLVPGSIVNGNTAGANDDNDGFTSGTHIFEIWNGPDDAWQLNWPGGDLNVSMTYPLPGTDLDLFLYEPGSYDDSFNYSILNTGLETISVPNAAAGTYYLVIDSEQNPGSYQLTVADVPEPASLGAIGCAVALLTHRRKRAM